MKLNGDWEFYWGKLLQPSDFKSMAPSLSHPKYFKLPGLSTDLDLPPFGYATFRLVILMDNPEQVLALKFQDVYAAFRVYAEGREIGRCGSVSSTREAGKDQIIPQVIDLPDSLGSDQVEIVLQISNHSMYYSGAPQVIRLGNRKQIHRLQNSSLAMDLFLFGSILVMALYHLGLYALRRSDKSSLYFSAFSIGTIFYAMLTGESFLFFLFPGIDVIGLYRILLPSIVVTLLFFSMSMREIFPGEFSLKPVRASQIFAAITIGCVIFTPSSIFIRTHIPIQIFGLAVMSYTIYSLVRASFKYRIEALSMLVGFGFWFAAGVNDILYYHLVIKSINLFPLGLFAFIFSQAFLLSIRFNKAFSMVAEMSGELEKNNQAQSRRTCHLSFSAENGC